jgi:hypothetical protein
MPDLRSASMNDIMPNQIPENTTYQSTIDQQQSPPSYQLSPGSISSQGKFKTDDYSQVLLWNINVIYFLSFIC